MAEQIENMDKKKSWEAILAVAVLLMISFAPLIATIICASISQIEWYWSLFVFFSWSFPCEYFFFALFQFNKVKDKVKNALTLVRNILVSVLLAFFILAVCCSWVTAQFVFGTLLIINGLWVVISKFLASYKPYALELILETLLALGLTVYLIYLIPESENFGLREIVTGIVAAVYGGLLALVGVAWTIKHNSKQNMEAEKRSIKPYIYPIPNKDISHNDSFQSMCFKSENPHGLGITFGFFKNIGNGVLVVNKIVMDEIEFFAYSGSTLEKNKIAKIEISIQNQPQLNEFTMHCVDVLNNDIVYKVEFSENKTIQKITEVNS